MKQKLICLLLLIVFWSCVQTVEHNISTEQLEYSKTDSTPDENSTVSTFNYEAFEIKKGQLGQLRIGMTISQAESKFDGLRKEVDEAVNFGYGGGSPAYLYYDNKEIVFGLIPKLNTDVVLLIVAASSKLTTTNGLNPNSTVREISTAYPNNKVNKNYMNSMEVIIDTTNNWEFTFMTEELTIGNYPEFAVTSELLNFEIKSDWITIK